MRVNRQVPSQFSSMREQNINRPKYRCLYVTCDSFWEESGSFFETQTSKFACKEATRRSVHNCCGVEIVLLNNCGQAMENQCSYIALHSILLGIIYSITILVTYSVRHVID